jgi:hypothetical protein
MKALWLFLFALFCLSASPVGQSQTLTTAPDNNGSGGVFINLQSLNGPVTVSGFDVPLNADAGLPVSRSRSGSDRGATRVLPAATQAGP